MGFLQTVKENKMKCTILVLILVISIVICITLPLVLPGKDKEESTDGLNVTDHGITVDPVTSDLPNESTTTRPIRPTIPPDIPDNARDNLIECPLVSDVNEVECAKQGCVWNEPQALNEPKCIMDSNTPNYFVASEVTNKTDRTGFTVTIKRRPKTTASTAPSAVSTAVPSMPNNAAGQDHTEEYQDLVFEMTTISKNIFRIQFKSPADPPKDVPFPDDIKFEVPVIEEQRAYRVELNKDVGEDFSFQVIRKDDDAILFDSSIGNLIVSKRFHQISGNLSSRNVYGIGENFHESFKHDFKYRKWPLFSRDQRPVAAEDQPPTEPRAENLYGVHPYYTCLEPSGKSHGVLFLNSNPMEFIFSPMQSVTFRSIGGNLDMIFMLGDNPEHTVKLYSEVIGKPMVPPLWSLGFQLSRYGYMNLENMTRIINQHRDNKLPLDVVHADIDHLEDNKDFTFDNTTFKGFDEFVIAEQGKGLRFIPIVDPAILATDEAYTTYAEGFLEDVFIKWSQEVASDEIENPLGVNTTKRHMYGKVWPKGPVAFPDFMKTKTIQWWKSEIKNYWNLVKYNGIWLDMNEPANFGTNEDKPFYCETNENECWSLKCPSNPVADLSKIFQNMGKGIEEKTLCMAAVQGNSDEYKFPEVHSLYGLWQSKATYEAVKESGSEGYPLVISRSTYPSSGRYAGHWLGDNRSSWEQMRRSIIGMLEFSLFLIPYTGSDVCGFFGTSEPQLCARWMQLGAFYPFFRNHNNMGEVDQDPVSILKPIDKYFQWAKLALETRYILIPYLQTLHYQAGLEGGTVVRPLFHEFPLDIDTYNIDEQFMWGPALLISPVLRENSEVLEYYLPAGVWFDFYTKEKIEIIEGQLRTAEGMNADNNRTPLHVRGGHIIATAEPGSQNTNELLKKAFELRVYPNEDGIANGVWFFSHTTDKDIKNSYREMRMKFDRNNKTMTIICPKASWTLKPTLKVVNVYDTTKPAGNVTLSYLANGVLKTFQMEPKEDTSSKGFNFDMPSRAADLCDKDLDRNDDYKFEW